MNIRLLSLALAIQLAILGAAAFPVFASQGNPENYGAGFMPSPTQPAEAPAASVANYGAAYTGPVVTVQTGAPQQTINTAYYGAAFTGAPTVIYSNRYAGVRGFYGAGYLPSPLPWYGGGFRLFGFGGFNRWYW